MDIKGKKCVVIGGGAVAQRKIEKLLPFEPEIYVIAPYVREEILSLSVNVRQRNFRESDLSDAFMAISATDDRQLNSYISQLCREKNILINAVDDPENCGFFFPAIVHREDITVGVSTSGKSPVYAKFLKEQIDRLMNQRLLDTAGILIKYRPRVKAGFGEESQRKKVMEAILALCLESEEMPDDGQITALIEEMRNSNENKNRNT
jgi:siroheme synthase-like protein